MANVRVPVAGTIGKSVSFDPQAGARAEAAVEALARAIDEGIGSTVRHSSLLGLQIGDDHPQYTMWQAPETIQGLWNFQTIPLIQGDTLAEYIEDVVGGSFFDFLQDTTSVVWTYHETANELEANVPPEFVQDTVGAMLADTASIDLSYNDLAGTFSAAIIDEYVQDLIGSVFVDSTSIDFTYNDLAGTMTAATINANPSGLIGMSAVNGTAATPLRSDGRHAIDPAINPTWTGQHEFFAASGVPARFLRQGLNGLGAAGIMSIDTDAKTAGDSMLLVFRGNNSAISTHDQNYAFLGAEIVSATAGTESGSFDFYTINAGAGPSKRVSIRPNGNTQLLADNQELQIGAGQDLRMYHDGTNSVIRNDTGALLFLAGSTEIARLTASGSFQVGSSSASNFGLLLYRNNTDAALACRQDGAGPALEVFKSGGGQAVRITSAGALQIVDGLTAPATDASFASIYVDAADGDLKIKFGDGTVKTIVTD